MPSATWVVYAVPTRDGSDPVRAVCEQREWETLSAAHPGALTLVRGKRPVIARLAPSVSL